MRALCVRGIVNYVHSLCVLYLFLSSLGIFGVVYCLLVDCAVVFHHNSSAWVVCYRSACKFRIFCLARLHILFCVAGLWHAFFGIGTFSFSSSFLFITVRCIAWFEYLLCPIMSCLNLSNSLLIKIVDSTLFLLQYYWFFWGISFLNYIMLRLKSYRIYFCHVWSPRIEYSWA